MANTLLIMTNTPLIMAKTLILWQKKSLYGKNNDFMANILDL